MSRQVFDRRFRQAFATEQETAPFLEEIYRQALVDDADFAKEDVLLAGFGTQQLTHQRLGTLPMRANEFTPGVL